MPVPSPRSEQSVLKVRVLLALAFLLTAAAYLSGALEFVEREITDLKFAVIRRPPATDLILIAIDARSLRDIGVWPWPRSHHALLLERLDAAGASRIAFDIDFSSPSSAQADAELDRALAGADGKVVLAAHKQVQHGVSTSSLIYAAALPRFAEHAVTASVNVSPDGDGLVRRMPLRDRWRDRVIPSLAAYLADEADSPLDEFSIDFGIDPRAIARISFADVLAGHFDPAAIRGKTVIVGATALELGDRIPVPVYKSISGVEFLGLGYESLRQGRALQRTGPGPVLAITGLLAMLLGPKFFAWPARRALLVTAAMVVGIVALSLLAQWLWPILLDAAPPVTLMLLLLPCALVSGIDRSRGSCSFNVRNSIARTP